MRNKLLCGVATLAIVAAIGGPAVAADLPRKAAPAPAPMYVPPSWAGFYIGGSIGYGWSKFNGDNVSELGNLSVKPSGAVAGVHAGYNWQVNQWVFGLEGDLMGTFGNGWSKRTGSGASSGMYGHLHGLATIRGRLGWAFDRTLVYATGGVAFAPRAYDAGTEINGSTSGGVNYANKTRTGWVAGGGIEWMYNQNLSFRLEGLHYGFNENTIRNSGDEPTTGGIKTADVVRVGFSYYFR